MGGTKSTNRPALPDRKVLPEAVAEVYQVAEGVMDIFVCSEFGQVDLSTVTLEFAAQLEEKGYLKKTLS